MTTATLKKTRSLRLSPELTNEVEKLGSDLGLTFSAIVTLLLQKFVREKRIVLEVPDNHITYYNDANSFEVNEKAETVKEYLEKSLKADDKKTRKISR